MKCIFNYFALFIVILFATSCKEKLSKITEAEIKQSYKEKNIPYCREIYHLSKEDVQSITWYATLGKNKIHEKGYTDIPIKQGQFKLRIPNNTIASPTKVCDYHDGKGYQLEEILFGFKWISSSQSFITKFTELPLKDQQTGSIPSYGTRGINMYNLSQDVSVDDQSAAERSKIMSDNKRYQPAYPMNYYPLIYYPNINYDNYEKQFNGEYYPKYYPTDVGIKGLTDDATGKPMLINCSIYRFNLVKDTNGNEMVDRESMLNSNLTRENSHGDERLGSTCKGYPQYIKKYGHFFVFNMHLNDDGARALDKIAKNSYYTLKDYILPIDAP